MLPTCKFKKKEGINFFLYNIELAKNGEHGGQYDI